MTGEERGERKEGGVGQRGSIILFNNDSISFETGGRIRSLKANHQFCVYPTNIISLAFSLL